VANPQHVTLVADTNLPVTLDANYAAVEVTIIANPAVTYFNTRGATVPTTGGTLASLAGNHVLPAVLGALQVLDETAGAASVVNLRSAGTPTVCIRGI